CEIAVDACDREREREHHHEREDERLTGFRARTGTKWAFASHRHTFRQFCRHSQSPDGGTQPSDARDEIQGVLRKTRFSLDIRRCFAAQAGYTLIELLIAMMLLGVILAALVSGFTTAIRAETDQTARANDRESAREALERMRQDIHCAS